MGLAMTLAFKSASEAAKGDSKLGRIFSLGISKVTGGKFSHVEIVLDTVNGESRCFSAREPGGTGFEDIDLSDKALWTEVVVAPEAEKDANIFAWCQGRQGRRYNFAGILGIESGGPITDPHDDFCSQCALECIQDNLGMFTAVEPHWCAPSGFGKDGKRWGLYELITGEQKA